MKRRSTLLLGVFLLCSACDDGDGEADGDEGGGDRADVILGLSGDATAGQTVFSDSCGLSACHGADGNTPGTAATAALSNAAPMLDDKEIVETIIFGSGSMPAQILSDQQVADVLAYVDATFG